MQLPSIPCRVAIFDDHSSVRDMLTEALCKSGAYEIVGECGNGLDVVDVCLRVRPDLVILDMILPGINGVEVLGELRAKLRGLKVVFFSGCLQEQLISSAIALGAAAYVCKTERLSHLLSAINAVATGGTFFDPAIVHLADKAGANPDWQPLSRREREVVQLIARGRSTKEAATELGISSKTLDKHRSRMMKKLHLHDAVAVTHYAIQSGLISL